MDNLTKPSVLATLITIVIIIISGMLYLNEHAVPDMLINAFWLVLGAALGINVPNNSLTGGNK